MSNAWDHKSLQYVPGPLALRPRIFNYTATDCKQMKENEANEYVQTSLAYSSLTVLVVKFGVPWNQILAHNHTQI